MTTLDIKGICMSGGNVIISASNFTTLDIKSIVLTAKAHGVKVHIKEASKLSPLACKGIAISGGLGTVTFDFSE